MRTQLFYQISIMALLCIGCGDQASLLNNGSPSGSVGLFSPEDTGYKMQTMFVPEANGQSADELVTDYELISNLASEVSISQVTSTSTHAAETVVVSQVSEIVSEAVSVAAPVAEPTVEPDPVPAVTQAVVQESVQEAVVVAPVATANMEVQDEQVQVLSPNENFSLDEQAYVALEVPENLYQQLQLDPQNHELSVQVDVEGHEKSYCSKQSGRFQGMKYDKNSNHHDKYYWQLQVDLDKYRCRQVVEVKYHCDGQGRSFVTQSKKECSAKEVKFSVKMKKNGREKLYVRSGKLNPAPTQTVVQYVPEKYWDFSSSQPKCIERAKSKNQQSASARK